MDWISVTFNWYLYLLILGAAAFPFTKKIFHGFFDKGYPFAKTIAILILSFVMFILGIYKIAPFTQTTLVIILIILVLGLFYLNRTYSLPQIKLNRQFSILIIEELLFIGSLFFLTYIRGQEPSIHGLEKFMDYGFMKSILRSKFFPPLDIWYAGNNPINYYYFGHLTGAVLIKLTDISAQMGYNLILATIFAQSITLIFSLAGNIAYFFHKSLRHALITGEIGSIIVNLAGNLHTIYLFTSGYQPDNPVPFWQILSKYDPTKYWYPNATRFIPFTIHEFPSYSYVVADLHGHVFDIPFVILTLAILFLIFTRNKHNVRKPPSTDLDLSQLIPTISLGFMTAVHYMTNAFDGPIYLLLTGFLFFTLFGINRKLIFHLFLLALSYYIFSLPFTSHFSLFVSGIGINCSPDFLVSIKKFGPFLFEKGNCQPDPLWMLFILWGFFWVCFLLFFIIKLIQQKQKTYTSSLHTAIDDFIFVCFTFGTILIFIPEFFYIKDIYPAHFRANTMFKMGYQAFIIMGIASSYVFFRLSLLKIIHKIMLVPIFLVFFGFVFVYPFYSFPSYYGAGLSKTPVLDGLKWMEAAYPEDKEIVDFLNEKIPDQPVILEAQGDSYTDFERISSYTGLPTVAGWWVHEWLWRGSADVIGKRIPDVVTLYESKNIQQTKELIKKYNIKYVVVSRMERDKYKNLYEEKFSVLGDKIYTTANKFGALYQLKNN